MTNSWGYGLFTEEDALDDLNKLKLDSNLDFQINILYQTGPADCVGKVWGSNLDQGKVVDTDINNNFLGAPILCFHCCLALFFFDL